MIKLHHINLSAPDIGPMADFYKDVLGFEEFTEQRRSIMVGELAKASPTRIFGQQDLELHLSRLAPYYKLPTGRIFKLNPTERGHNAYRTDDIDDVKRRLRAAGIPFADYGVSGVPTWYQIYVKDPMGNTVEIHQVVDTPTPGPDIDGIAAFPE